MRLETPLTSSNMPPGAYNGATPLSLPWTTVEEVRLSVEGKRCQLQKL